MKIGCCSDDIDDHIRIEEAGFDYIELPVSVLKAELPAETYELVRNDILSWDIKPEVWNGFVPENIPVCGDEVDHYRLEKLTRAICERIEELGGEILVFNTPPCPQGFSETKAFEQTTEFLSLAGKIASAHGITIAVEPVSNAQISTVTDGLKIIRAVNNPFVKLLADTFHMSAKSKVIADIANGGEDIVHVHLSGIGRAVPKSSEDNHKELFEKLTDVGYDDRISIQCNWTDFSAEAPLALQLLRSLNQKLPTRNTTPHA